MWFHWPVLMTAYLQRVVTNKSVLIGVSSAIFFVPGFLLFIPGGKCIHCFLQFVLLAFFCTTKCLSCFLDINTILTCMSYSVPCDIHQLCCPGKERLQIILLTLFWKMTLHFQYIYLFAILKWNVFFFSLVAHVCTHGCFFLSL